MLGRNLAQAAAGNVGEAASNAWSLEHASFTGTGLNAFYVGNDEGGPEGLDFKTDGTKMYIVGYSQDKVFEYDLSTAYDVSTASLKQSFSVSSEDTNPVAVRFKSDGTKMFVLGRINGEIYEYHLSTAWDVSTASYDSLYSVESKDNIPLGLAFTPDGTKFWIVGNEADRTHEYSLSTAWDISTASYLRRRTLSEAIPRSVFVKADGSSWFYLGSSNDKLQEFTTSTAYSIVSISLGDNLNLANEGFIPVSMWFRSDGTDLFVLDAAERVVSKYEMTTGWDLSTATFSRPTTEIFDVSSEDTTPKGIFFKDDGTRMFVVGSVGDEVNEYHLSTAWDLTTASYDSRLYIGGQEAAPGDIHFKPDGTKMYVSGEGDDGINQWNLSTAWDISTASHYTVKSTSSQDLRPRGVAWKDDGTKMYVLGSNSDTVYEYTVSVAWDVSYASYSSNSFSLSGIESNPYALFFKEDDGTRMYVGSSTGRIHEIALSTAWDITSGSLTHTFNGDAVAERAYGIAFKPDGTKLFVVDPDNDDVVAFTIS